MPDWKKIKAEYIRGGISYKKLSEKYGVSFSSIVRRARSEKWTDLRKKAAQKANTKIVESVAVREADRVAKYMTVADKILRKIDEGVESGELLYNPKAIHELTGAIRDLKEIHGLRTALDDEEQKARIEKLRNDAKKDQNIDDEKEQYGVFLMPKIMEVPADE